MLGDVVMASVALSFLFLLGLYHPAMHSTRLHIFTRVMLSTTNACIGQLGLGAQLALLDHPWA